MNLVINGRLITRDEGGKGYYEHGAVAYEGATITEVALQVRSEDSSFRKDRFLFRKEGFRV